VQVPIKPSDQPRYQDPIDDSLIFYKGENLVIDLVLSDIYGNKISQDVSLENFQALFIYGPDSPDNTAIIMNKQAFQSIVSFSLADLDNRIWKGLPPRAGTGYYQIQLTYTTQDMRTQHMLIPIKLVSPDWSDPMNYIIPKFDKLQISANLSSVNYDSMIKAGMPGRIYITIRNQDF
jgi:hypothetical protein